MNRPAIDYLPEQTQNGKHAIWPHHLATLLRVALFVLAVVSLRHQLRGIALDEIRLALRSYGWRHVILSVGFTAASFLAMGAFELLGLRYLRKEKAAGVSAVYAMSTGMVANAFTQSVGFALFTGAAVRMHAYRRFAFEKADIVRLSSFITVTATLGLLATGMVAFLTGTGSVRLAGSSVSLLPIGIVFAALILLYAAWVLFRPGKKYGRRTWSFEAPTRRVGALQLAISSFDWILAATVLFFLVPASFHLSYFVFLPAFFVAQSLAMASHVPGGIGVFESIFAGLTALPGAAKAAILASLLIYRLVYYVLPLGISLVVAAIHVMKSRQVAPTMVQRRLRQEAY